MGTTEGIGGSLMSKRIRTQKQIEQFERFRAKGTLKAAQGSFLHLSRNMVLPRFIRAEFLKLSRLCRMALQIDYWRKTGRS